MTYWDPLPTALACAEDRPLPGLEEFVPSYNPSWGQREDAREERDWRGVPGPFYASGTDTCWTGRTVAPGHVLYEDDFGTEFLYRQPCTVEETLRVVAASWLDPMAGYACDGDSRWTPDLVREWWRDRGRVREWAVRLDRAWSASQEEQEREAAGGARAYVAHIDGDLGDRLRHYVFWLAEGHPAGAGETLPRL